MSAQASIDVQFKPFRLTLMRGSDGEWVASLFRLGDDHVPIVVAHDGHYGEGPGITVAGGTPRLRIGDALFAVPTRQLQRLRDWIDQQRVPLVIDNAPPGRIDLSPPPGLPE